MARTARLYFTSIDDVVLISDANFRLMLNNYNKELHDQSLSDIHHFIRFNSTAIDSDLMSCFSSVSIDLALNYQTMLNLRLVAEHIVRMNRHETDEYDINKDCGDACKQFIRELHNPHNDSMSELERLLKLEATTNILAFLNGDDPILQDRVNTYLDEKVATY